MSETDDDALARAFAGESDDDLVRQWDDAARWRDWHTCDLVWAEQCRREQAAEREGAR